MSMEWDLKPPSASVGDTQSYVIGDAGKPLYLPREQVIRTPKCGARGQLSNSNGTLYTAPSDTSPTGSTQGAILKTLVLCNTDSSTRTVTIYVVESGGSAAANRMILSVMPIAAGQTLELFYADDEFPLDSGESIQGLASTASVVTYRINVVELTN